MRIASRGLSLFIYIALSILMAGTTFALFFYYQSGLMDGSNVTNIHESDHLYKEITKSDFPGNVYSDLVHNNISTALNNFDQIKNNIQKIHYALNIKDEVFSVSMMNELVSARGNLAKLVAYPSVASVYKVIDEKIEAFVNFASENNWRTLTRSSQVLQSRLKGSRDYSLTSLQSISNLLDREIENMSKVTQSSVLSSENKIRILARLDNFKKEREMLTVYINELKEFTSHYQLLQKEMKRWSQELSPLLTAKRIKVDDQGQSFVMIMAGLLGLTVFFLIIALKLTTVFENKQRKQMIEYFFTLVQEGIFQKKENVHDIFVGEEVLRFNKLKDYIHRRMSFGRIFQEALPFPAILLDSNLKIIWANTLFYDSLSITMEKDSEDLTWDYIQSFTNVGENDPIYDAFNNNLSGIYQIQMRSPKSEDSVPYEMYVTPQEFDGQKRVMVFFYNLSTVQETISNQLTTTINPIVQAVNAIMRDSFDEENFEKIKNGFQIADQLELFQHFEKFNEFFILQKQGLMNEIEKLENVLVDKNQMIKDLSGSIEQIGLNSQKLTKHFAGMKELIVKTSETNLYFDQYSSTVIKESKKMQKDYSTFLEKTSKMVANFCESLEQLHLMGKMRDQLKNKMSIIEEARGKVLESLEQTLVFLKSDRVEKAKIDMSLNGLKAEVKSLDRTVNDLQKEMVPLDVKLSKANILLENQQSIITKDEIKNEIDQTFHRQSHLEEMSYEMKKNHEQSLNIENDFVNELKKIYDLNKNIQRQMVFNLAENNSKEIVKQKSIDF